MIARALGILLTIGIAVSAAADDELKDAASAQVGEMAKLTQVMVDNIFSFGELGFQEVETSRVSDRPSERARICRRRGNRRHSDRVDGELGLGKTGHRFRKRHRRDSQGVAEAGSRVPRSTRRRSAGTRRRT